MKITEAKSDPNIKLVTLKKTVDVTYTEKHPGYPKKKKSMVPAHMVDHLLKKGMIVDLNAKKAKD